MPPMVRDRYLEPYRQSASRHGPGFSATLWASPASQRLRFEVFHQMVDLTGRRVLDAGCSRGDFAAYLIQQGVAFDQYVGIDGVAEVVAFAEARGLARCRFLEGDFLADPGLLAESDPEVICISGTLNTMSEGQVLTLLASAWSAARRALLFNILTDLARPRAPQQTGPARRHSGLRLLRWATERTGRVVYRQDYFPDGHDATILMGREGA